MPSDAEDGSSASGPRCEWVRDDIALAATKALREMKRVGEANAHRPAEHAVAKDTIYLNITKLNGKRNQPDRYRCDAISGLPEGHELTVFGQSVADCEFEARHALLDIYKVTRMPADTHREILDRLHRTSLVVYSE